MRLTLATLAVAALTGCGADVASSANGPDGLPVFVTSVDVSIGEVDGDLPYLLAGVTDAHRLSDGRIVIGDCQSSELRYFSADGEHLRTVGGAGQGPGEFAWLTRILPAGGDSIAVVDQRSMRISVFDPSGSLTRDFSTADAGRSLLMKGRLRGGAFVGLRSDRSKEPSTRQVYRIPQYVVRLDADGVIRDSVGPLPGPESVATEQGRTGVRLGRGGFLGVWSRGIVHSDASAAGPLRFEATLSDSTRVAPFRVPGPVTESDRTLFTERIEDMVVPGGVLPVYSDMYSDSLPVHGDLYVDREGGLWLQDPGTHWDYSTTYTRFTEGAPELRVQLPHRFFPFELHPDGILGVAYDESGVERVQLLVLTEGDTVQGPLTQREVGVPAVPRCGSWASR